MAFHEEVRMRTSSDSKSYRGQKEMFTVWKAVFPVSKGTRKYEKEIVTMKETEQ